MIQILSDLHFEPSEKEVLGRRRRRGGHRRQRYLQGHLAIVSDDQSCNLSLRRIFHLSARPRELVSASAIPAVIATHSCVQLYQPA